MNIKKGKILKKMNLKEKKIIQCSYVDSEGKIYDVGYGDDLSPEISLLGMRYFSNKKVKY